MKGPSMPGVIPKTLTLITQEAQQSPTPSHSTGFFPKQNAPKGLRGLGKKAESCKQVSLLQCQPQFGLFLSWEKASRAISSNTAPLGRALVCLGDYLRESSKLWIVQDSDGSHRPSAPVGRSGCFWSRSHRADCPFLFPAFEDKGLNTWEWTEIGAVPSDPY